jgi:hypothetical protein
MLLSTYLVFSQEKIPAWDFSDWGHPRTNSDIFHFLAYRVKNYDALDYYTLNLVDIPMGEARKPAMLLKVKDDDYPVWSADAEIEAIAWKSQEVAGYVVLVLEVWFAAPVGKTLGDTTGQTRNLNKLHFRQFFDPQSAATERLLKDWAALQGPMAFFFMCNYTMNYYYNSPEFADWKKMPLDEFYKAKAKLANIVNKSTYQNAVKELVKKYPLVERYSIILQ